MDLRTLVETSQRVTLTSRRLEKIDRLAAFLRQLEFEEVPIAVSYLSGYLPQGKIGIGYASLRDARPDAPSGTPPLALTDVDDFFHKISAVSGPGSSAARAALIREMMGRARPEEQDFLVRLILGELRQGSLEGIMIEALARAADIPAGKMRKAAMLAGNLPLAGRVALEKGPAGLEQFDIHPLHPFQPMLAQTAADVGEALETIRDPVWEYKMDGVRIQAHKLGRDARIFTRNLNDISEAAPEIIEALLSFPAESLVLDGEVLAFGNDGRPRSFQTTMRRFGRKLDVAAMRRELPLTPYFFDCLFLNGTPLLDQGEDERFRILAQQVPQGYRMPRIRTADHAAANAFLSEARSAGHEGVMAKDPEGPYEPGIRSSSWLKVKPAHTLDLVILAAEWGHGRRSGRLSNLHLGARDPETGGYVMLGKTFKGLTDAMLEWQTRRLLELEISRDAWTVYVRPEIVVEIAFNNIQASPHYPSGLALRFARVKRYRPDKSPTEADTIETVRKLSDI